MNAVELANELNGTEYPFRPTREVIQKAIDNSLVIVYGASDDLMEFEGAIVEEIGVYDGGTAYVYKCGVLGSRDDLDTDEELELWFKNKSDSKPIEAKWCDDDNYSWTYQTDIPHATFDIVEGDEKYCRALVFSVDEI
ncbi:hypothetical protein [Alteromonas sp. AMM-1]|uniref:hypothetical protein n=1 Tax=Alteromonas sp. AMM-1 TaxID=3394233 RepID=UPI0039A443D7